MVTLSIVLTRWQGLFFLMSQTHYWPLQILSVTKRASPNYLLAWASCLPLLPALVHLWLYSQQQSFILFCVSLQPHEWLDLLHYHTNQLSISGGVKLEGHRFPQQENLHPLKPSEASHIFPQLYELLWDVPWSFYFSILWMSLVKKQETEDEKKQHTSPRTKKATLRMVKWSSSDS